MQALAPKQTPVRVPRPPDYSPDAAALHAAALTAQRVAQYLRAQASMAVVDAAANRPANRQRRDALLLAELVNRLKLPPALND